MKKQQILLTVALLFATVLINAQDKYEFLIIEYSSGEGKIGISIDGKEFYNEKANLSNQQLSGNNANPLLKKVSEYQNSGWELMNFQALYFGTYSTDETFFAYMRKKKVE